MASGGAEPVILDTVSVSQVDSDEQLVKTIEEKEDIADDQRSTRKRTATMKMAELQREEMRKEERTFSKHYGSLKTVVYNAREIMKKEINLETITNQAEVLESHESKLMESFNKIRAKAVPEQSIKMKMDQSSSMVRDCINALDEIEGSLERPFIQAERKVIVRGLLVHEYAKSVYGSSVSRRSTMTYYKHASPKHVELEAEVAAREAEMRNDTEIMLVQNQQRFKLKEMEDAREIESLRARIEVYKRDMPAQTEDEDSDIPSERPPSIFSQRSQRLVDETNRVKPENALPNKTDQSRQERPKEVKGPATITPEIPQQSATDINALAQIFGETVHRSRLPPPIPTTFTGNPLEYMEFERSFQMLIESRGLLPSERLYYLKQYLAGTAKEAVQGLLYGNTEEAYQRAWATLRDRYGHPFKIEQAYRIKLKEWPKINTKDATSLQKFADFLQSCKDATSYVEGLHILDDCIENQRILNKLPDWMISRWNRMVTEVLDKFGKYPSFSEFTAFVTKEARVSNNPISSFQALRCSEGVESFNAKTPNKKESLKGKLTTLATESKDQGKQDQPKTYVPKPCLLCPDKNHQLEACPQFARKMLVDRKKYIRENKLCYGCFKTGHVYKFCRKKSTCITCGKKHHTLLHEESVNANAVVHKSANNKPDASTGTTITSHRVNMEEDQVSTSMIVPVWVSSEREPLNEVLTYALLDTQSDSSFVLDSVANSLMINQQPVRLKLATMTSSSIIDSNVVNNLQIRGMNHSTSIKLNKCYTRDFIPVDHSHIPTKNTAESWSHLQPMSHQMSNLQECDVGLLIGYNCPRALAPTNIIRGDVDEPYAVETELGWSIVGSTRRSTDQEASGRCFRVIVKESPNPAPNEILKMLELDFAENYVDDKAYSQEDLRFVQRMEDEIHRCSDGNLEMPLPFRKRPTLPNNKRLASIRLKHLERKCNRNDEFKKQYVRFMNELIIKGYAERAPELEQSGSTNYIPHHGVYHQKKGKLRVVFDCSAKFEDTCLNDHLLKGPDLTNSLVGVLCRFRKHRVAILCDIEKMFFQFRVNQEDRDFLRFLWYENGDTTKEPISYRMTVHLFGASSSPGCANFGLRYLAEQHSETYPSASKFIKGNFYVDDGVISVPSTEEAIQLVKDSRDLCQKGNIRLHKFVSNNRTVLENIPISERAEITEDRDLEFDEIPMERALGITWNPTGDSLHFAVSLKKQPMTRRGILSTVASLYDPLGFVAPVILQGKRILQEMCRNKMGWDDVIPPDLKPRWEQWLDQLEQLEPITIPRCYHPDNFGEPVRVELHHFSDASMNGYGQCTYLRLINEKGEVHCCLVFAKARVTPTKVITIPRLELTAAVVSVKVSSMLKEELDYKDIHEFFWTDSMVVIGYINNEARRFHTFVANRVQLIRERTLPKQWKYIDTDNNPADHASRGLSPKELSVSRWFKGPKLLWETQIENQEVTSEIHSEDPEVKTTVLTGNTELKSVNLLNRLDKYSNWQSMITGLTLLRETIKKTPTDSSLEEKEKTESWVVKMVQENAFSDELKTLTNGNSVSSTSSIHNLQPYKDKHGLLRVGGRLQNSTFPERVKHPLIMPRDDHITRLITSHFHEKTHHQGRGQTMNEIRNNGYWIIGGSRVVSEAIKKCVKCRKLRRSSEEQKMAELPAERVEPSAPFTYVGMDCFGPFKIKRGRTELKRYGLIFTCFCSRGIHIEMLDDLSTDVFINGLRCFIAIRGSVRSIRCDQGTNFIGADNELKLNSKDMNMDKVKKYLENKQCEFIFNAPHSSHAGGVWERQIRTVRNVLRSTIDLCPGRLDDASLRTLFYEAMAIVNSRPLTPFDLSDPHADPPLTPNHLLTMKNSMPLPPPGTFVKEDMYARKRWRRVQYLMEQFWSRWKKEYLLSLNQRQRWNTRRRNLKEGDIVIIKDDMISRMEWPMAVVTEATTDDDGLVRKVKLSVGTKTLDKNGKRTGALSTLERPVQKLVLILESV